MKYILSVLTFLVIPFSLLQVEIPRKHDKSSKVEKGEAARLHCGIDFKEKDVEYN